MIYHFNPPCPPYPARHKARNSKSILQIKNMYFTNLYVKEQFEKIEWTTGSFEKCEVNFSNLRTENAVLNHVKNVAVET